MATAPDRPVSEALVRKIGALPPTRAAEVEDFVDLLSQCERTASNQSLRRAAAGVSAPSFAAVWSKPEDDVYDAL